MIINILNNVTRFEVSRKSQCYGRWTFKQIQCSWSWSLYILFLFIFHLLGSYHYFSFKVVCHGKMMTFLFFTGCDITVKSGKLISFKDHFTQMVLLWFKLTLMSVISSILKAKFWLYISHEIYTLTPTLQTQNLCITFVQRRPKFSTSTLHKCYTNILCLLPRYVSNQIKMSLE